jgi:hypothetical protein
MGKLACNHREFRGCVSYVQYSMLGGRIRYVRFLSIVSILAVTFLSFLWRDLIGGYYRW